MKYLSLIPLAGLAVAAPSWSDDPVVPVKVSTTTAASSWYDADLPVTETKTATASVTYCSKSGKITKPAPDNDVAKCTLSVTKVTVTAATATVTVTEKGHGGYPGKETVTVTETKTKDCTAPTDGPKGPGGPPHGGDKCLTDDAAKKIVDNFRDLLEFTSYNGTQGAPGRGYHQAISDATLAADFTDISDSINFMAGKPLGSLTFPSKKAFDIGQGANQPEVKTETLNIFHDCSSITWRWKITPQVDPRSGLTAYPVVGINYMIIDDKNMIKKNYAEFDNGAWLQSFGKQCAVAPVTVGPNALKN